MLPRADQFLNQRIPLTAGALATTFDFPAVQSGQQWYIENISLWVVQLQPLAFAQPPYVVMAMPGGDPLTAGALPVPASQLGIIKRRALQTMALNAAGDELDSQGAFNSDVFPFSPFYLNEGWFLRFAKIFNAADVVVVGSFAQVQVKFGISLVKEC